MDKFERIIFGLLKEMVDSCSEEQMQENRCLDFSHKDNTYFNRPIRPLSINSEEQIPSNSFSYYELEMEKVYDMPKPSLSKDHPVGEVMYKNSSDAASTQNQHISHNLKVLCDLSLPENKNVTQAQNTLNEKVKKERQIHESLDMPISDRTGITSTSNDLNKGIHTCGNEPMTSEKILIISPMCKEQFDEIMAKTTAQVLLPVENTSEKNIDLRFENYINDYSAETPALVTDQQNDIRSVVPGVRSPVIGNCQIKSKNYELTDLENVLLDEDETLTHYTKVELQKELLEMQPFCCEDHVLANGIQESVIDQAKSHTKMEGFINSTDAVCQKSGQSKSDITFKSINSKQISLENPQFKYICEDSDEGNLEDYVNDINKLDLSDQNNWDAPKDIQGIAELVINTSTTTDGINSEKLYPHSPIKTNIIMRSCKLAESIEISKKLEINLFSALHEESIGSQEKCVSNSFNDKVMIFSGDENFVDRSDYDDEELLASELNRGQEFSVWNGEFDDQYLPKHYKQISMNFDSIENMPVLRSYVDKTPKEITSVNPSDINRKSAAWCVNSDGSEDNEVFAPTQHFKPNISSDMIGLYVEDQQEFDDDVYNLKGRKKEDEAIVPEPSKVLDKEHQTYTTDSEPGLFKPDFHQLAGKQCFKWSTYTQQITEDHTNDSANGEKIDLTKSGPDFPGLRQLVECSRPMRLGLSKKQKTKRLHPYFH